VSFKKKKKENSPQMSHEVDSALRTVIIITQQISFKTMMKLSNFWMPVYHCLPLCGNRKALYRETLRGHPLFYSIIIFEVHFAENESTEKVFIPT